MNGNNTTNTSNSGHDTNIPLHDVHVSSNMIAEVHKIMSNKKQATMLRQIAQEQQNDEIDYHISLQLNAGRDMNSVTIPLSSGNAPFQHHQQYSAASSMFTALPPTHPVWCFQ